MALCVELKDNLIFQTYVSIYLLSSVSAVFIWRVGREGIVVK